MLKRLLRGVTRATLLTYLLIVLAGLLFFIQFLILQWWFAAAGVIPMVGATIVTTRKTHVAARAGAAAGLGSHSVLGRQAPRTRPNVPAVGRLAASMADDPERSNRIFEASNGMGTVDQAEKATGAVFLGIARPEFRDLLAQTDATFIAMNPSVVTTQVERLSPSAIVIDLGGFDAGPWARALDASGGAIFQELLKALDKVQSADVDVYVVTSDEMVDHVGAESLRKAATHVIHESGDEAAFASFVQTVFGNN